MWNTAVIHTLSLNSCIGMHPYTLQTCFQIRFELMPPPQLEGVLSTKLSKDILWSQGLDFIPTSETVWASLCYFTPPYLMNFSTIAVIGQTNRIA